MRLIDAFPLRAKVTKKILRKANNNDAKNCTGARTLNRALKKLGYSKGLRSTILWGRILGDVGSLRIVARNIYNIRIDMMKVTKPRYVYFYVKPH